MYYIRVLRVSTQEMANQPPPNAMQRANAVDKTLGTKPFIFQPMDEFLDTRYEDEALSALMEEAFSETKEEKFDVESYLNGEIDYA